MNTVLFDFDGVIADSLDYAFNWFGYAAGKFGVELPFENPAGFKDSFIEPFPEFYKWLGFDWEEDREAIYDAYIDYHAAHPVGLVDGIKVVISELGRKPGVKLGIVSSNDQQVLEDNLAHHDLAGYFDVVIGVNKDLSIPLKPNPTSLLMALSQLGSSLSESVYIGDQPSDILTAQNAEKKAQNGSLQTIGVTTGFATRSRLEKATPRPDHIIDHPLEILTALKQ